MIFYIMKNNKVITVCDRVVDDDAFHYSIDPFLMEDEFDYFCDDEYGELIKTKN